MSPTICGKHLQELCSQKQLLVENADEHWVKRLSLISISSGLNSFRPLTFASWLHSKESVLQQLLHRLVPCLPCGTSEPRKRFQLRRVMVIQNMYHWKHHGFTVENLSVLHPFRSSAKMIDKAWKRLGQGAFQPLSFHSIFPLW